MATNPRIEPVPAVPPATHTPRQRNHGTIRDLLINGSIEISGTGDPVAEAKDLLPFGMRVFVPSLPKRSVLDNLERLKALKAAGLDPVPHIAARRLESRRELEEFVRRATGTCGVQRVFVVGGDIEEPLGPFADAASVLREPVLTDCGIREIGIAGYPEGHPRIPGPALDAGIVGKLELAAKNGLGAFMVTQFSFAPARIVDCCARMARRYPDLPIYIGMPGPTDPAKLLRFARICGVSESLRALVGMGFGAVKLVKRTAPDEQLQLVGRYCASGRIANVVGVHVFSFGGFLESSAWMMAQARQ